MLVGLTGLAGSGKSEVAKILVEGYGFKRLAFADPLKSMLAAVGFTPGQLYGGEKATVIPELGKAPRELMQTLGTEWGREMVHPDFWRLMWERKARETLGFGVSVVADDVRFPNEVEAIGALGGVVCRISRPGVVAMGHASESHDLAASHTILNDGPLDWLPHEIAGLVESARQCA